MARIKVKPVGSKVEGIDFKHSLCFNNFWVRSDNLDPELYFQGLSSTEAIEPLKYTKPPSGGGRRWWSMKTGPLWVLGSSPGWR